MQGKASGIRMIVEALALMLMLVLFVMPESAFALELEQVWTGADSGAMSTAPNDAFNVSLIFDENVSYEQPGTGDISFVKENLGKVYVLDARANRVDSFVAKGASSKDEQKVIYLASSEWLDPVSEYTVVAEAGIRSAQGDVTRVEYRSVVKTTAQTSFGFSVYQVWGMAVAAIAVLMGAVVSLARKRVSR